MKLKNLLTGILLAGSALAYGQAPNDNYKKISELYGKRGERITYKDYSKIPWEQIDSNEIKIKNLEDAFVEPRIENKEGFRDSVFAEAEKLGYNEEKIKNLSAKESIDLSANILANRYKSFLVDDDTSFTNKYGTNLPNDRYFNLGLGDCDKYSHSFIGVFNIFREINKNLSNIYVTEASGKENELDKTGHSWDLLMLFTKNSMFLSEIDPTFYDNVRNLEVVTTYFSEDNKVQGISYKLDPIVSYYLNKELLAKIPDTSELRLNSANAKKYIQLSSEYSQLFFEERITSFELQNTHFKNKFLGGEDSLKEKSLSLKYKKIKKTIDSLTTKLNKREKENYELKRYGILREMLKSAVATEDTSILKDALNYFPKCSDEDYCLRKSMYYLYKNNKNKDKARKIKRELKERCMQEDWCNTKKEFDRYKRYALRYYLD